MTAALTEDFASDSAVKVSWQATCKPKKPSEAV